jgi:Domain of unknown function (DUF1906)
MGFRRIWFVLAIVLSCIVAGFTQSAAVAVPASTAAQTHSPAPAPSVRTVTYGRLSVRVPASWPVINLASHPDVCPRLDRHAVYLGTPGPDPACPAELVGKTGAVQLLPINPVSPDVRSATKPDVIDGSEARTNPNSAITHTIIDIIPAADVEVSLSYGADLATVQAIQASIRVSAAQRTAAKSGRRAAQPTGTAPAGTAPTGTAPAVTTAPAARQQGIYSGAGFDTCAAPSAGTMSSWLASPYRAIGIYIGGINRACAQPNLTSSWIDTIQAEGWHYWPFYVGLQASCVDATGDATIDASAAAAEGKAAADDAAVQAENLGIPPGTPIIYDMEAYANCGQQVVTFLSAWDSELHVDGYLAGVYESFSNLDDLLNAEGQMTEPDVIHYADWDGEPTTSSSYMPAGLWTDHQRLHQYLGGHNETWGNVTMDIDSDELNVNLGGSQTLLPLNFRIALGMNSNGTAEWFAKAADGAVLHAYQRPVGSTTWAPSRTVGDSPDDLVSNPAVTSEANGGLTLFAVNGSGKVVHAWQQTGAPNGWMWAGRIGSGSPGTIAGDPATALEPGGSVGVFVSDSDGTVMTTRQQTADDNTGWTRWTALGGACASSPVPFSPSSGTLSVICITESGSLAITSLAGSTWSPWQTVGNMTGLSGTPAVAVASDGQTYVFAATAAGGMDEAYQDAGSSAWLDGAGPAASQMVQGSPAAIAWPGGGVAVFSQLSNGQLGYAVGGGWGGWAAWTDLGIAMLGSPTAWLDSSGEPQAAVLDAQRKLAVAGYPASGWTAWTSLADGF